MNAVVQYQVSDMERMARAIAASKLFGVQNVEQALALCLVAQAEGRHPATAAQDYHIIQGRPAKKADAMLRDFLASNGKVEWHKLADDVCDATFSHPAGGSARIDWTMARAKAAGLTTAMWSKYPRQMLRARVVSEGVRTVFPMATSGMYVPEEVQEFEPQRGNDHEVIEGEIVEDRRVRNPATGRLIDPMSPNQARKDGRGERCDLLRHEIAELTEVTACLEWGQKNKAEIETFPEMWRTDLRETLADHLADLREASAAEIAADTRYDPRTGEIAPDDDGEAFPAALAREAAIENERAGQ